MKVFAGAKGKSKIRQKRREWAKAKLTTGAKIAKIANPRRVHESTKYDPKCYAASEVLTQTHLIRSLLAAKAKVFSKKN